MKVNIGRYLSTQERKINIEIENFDTWSLDHTLSLIIWPALIQLKHTKNGIPSDFVNDSAEDYCAQTSFDFMKEDKNEVFQKGCDAWETVLDKMIWSFQEIALGDYDSQYHHGNIRASWKKTGRHYEMVDENPDEHWYDQAGHRLHEKRIQEGLDLFAKYFRNLWD